MDKRLAAALIISLTAHITVLSGVHFRFPELTGKPQAKTVFFKTPPRKKPALKENTIIKAPPAYLKIPKSTPKPPEKINTYGKKIVSEKIEKGKTEIEIVKPQDFVGSLPAYMAYYDKIREKIKLAAFRLYETGPAGKVNINFALDSQGKLLTLSINPKQTTASKALQQIAVKSVRISEPFAAFPKDLSKFKTLSFNLYIDFRKEKQR
ncbi:hypothetical protein DRJ22_05865 [Candidatus Woesearchaeota archaeon]|nr:MAG: hypothetical protein DRJ22_05865 [Candidatus Woesearchaeota archaeon]